MQQVSRLEKTGGPGETIVAAWSAARQELDACLDARDLARKGVMEAVDFLHSRPQYVERFIQQRHDEVSSAQTAVLEAQEWLAEKMRTLEELAQRAISGRAGLPARLAPIAEEPEEWSAVAAPGSGALAAAQANVHGAQWPEWPSGGEDVALTGMSSLDATPAPPAF